VEHQPAGGPQVGNVWLAGDDTVDDLQTYADGAQSQLSQVEALWGDRSRFPGYILFFSRKKSNLRVGPREHGQR
jgi:hypothetical protein